MKRALCVSSLMMLTACAQASPEPDRTPFQIAEPSGFVEVFPYPTGVKDAGSAKIRLVVGGEVEADGVFELPYSQLFYGDHRTVQLDATSTDEKRWLSCSIYSGKVDGVVHEKPTYTRKSKAIVHCGE